MLTLQYIFMYTYIFNYIIYVCVINNHNKWFVCTRVCYKIHGSTQPPRSNKICSCFRRIWQDTEPNAALRSRAANKVTSALSAASKMADFIPSIAVLVKS